MQEMTINKTMNWMIEAHEGQYRMDGRPYFVHPMAVYVTVSKYTEDESLQKAALLHDVIEDTEWTAVDMEPLFGRHVVELVLDLTNDNAAIKSLGKPEYMAAKIKYLGDEALLIKLADRLDNVSDMHGTTEGFVRKYAAETRLIIGTLFNERSHFTKAHWDLVQRIIAQLPSGR